MMMSSSEVNNLVGYLLMMMSSSEVCNLVGSLLMMMSSSEVPCWFSLDDDVVGK